MPISEPYDRTFDESTSTTRTAEGVGCPECSGHVVTTDGETACTDCGLVLDDQPIDHGPEWREYEDEEQGGRKRTGAPLTSTRHDRGLSTEIGRYRDAKGNMLSGGKRRHLARLRREHKRGRWRSKSEQNLAHGLSEVQRLAGSLGLAASVRDQACALFRTGQDADLLLGRSIEAVAAASVYAACRCNRLSRTMEEVSGYARCDNSGVDNAYRTLNRELELPTPPPRPAEFVPRFAAELEVGDRVRERAFDLAKRAEEAGQTVGAQPTGFAAACLYKSSQEHGRRITQAAVADVADTSVVTIRSHRDRLDELLEDS